MTNHGFKLNGRSSDCGLPQQSVPLDAMVVDILITYCQSKTPKYEILSDNASNDVDKNLILY